MPTRTGLSALIIVVASQDLPEIEHMVVIISVIVGADLFIQIVRIHGLFIQGAALYCQTAVVYDWSIYCLSFLDRDMQILEFVYIRPIAGPLSQQFPILVGTGKLTVKVSEASI